MDSLTLLKNLKIITKNTSVKSCNVISADEWSKINLNNLPAAIIMHSENRNVRLGHYVAFFVDGLGGEMFDSYGNDVTKYATFVPIEIVKWNNKTLQCPSSVVCSYYCLFFLYHKCRGITMSNIIKRFGLDCKTNDAIVYNFFKNIKLCKCNGKKRKMCCSRLKLNKY